MKKLFGTIGTRLMMFIIVSLHTLKGFVFGGGGGGIVGIPILFLLRTFNKELNSVHIQILKTVAQSPWTLKSLLGIISDTTFLCGFNKFPYLCLLLIPSIASCFLIATTWPMTPVLYTLLLFVIYLHMATTDLFTEAAYSERLRRNPTLGPQLNAFIWGGVFVGQILSTVVTGILISLLSERDLHYIYIIPFILLSLSMVPTFGNWIGDTVHDYLPEKLYNLTCNNQVVIPLEKEENDFDIISEEEEEECLLCKRERGLIKEENDIEFINTIERYIAASKGVLSNRVIADQIYVNYFEKLSSSSSSEEDGEEGFSLRSVYKFKSKGLVPMKGDTILEHLEGYHSFVEEEEKEKEGEIVVPVVGFYVEKMKNDWSVFILAFLIGGISVAMAIVGLLQVDALYLCIISICGSVVLVCAFYLLVNRRIANVQTMILLQNLFSISIETAAFFFYTDTKEQYPEGPHFSSYFYVTVMGVVGAVFSLIGIILYERWMSTWTYRWVFCFNNVLFMFVSLSNVALYLRWNVAWGIPDYAFVLGTEAFQTIVSVWTYMPSTIIISQLCPKGLEATMYAILAGSSNLGNSFSQYQGAYLLQVLGVTPNGSPNESSKFEKLWIASVISSVIPLIPLVLVFYLMPNVKQTEKLLEVDDEEKDAKIIYT